MPRFSVPNALKNRYGRGKNNKQTKQNKTTKEIQSPTNENHQIQENFFRSTVAL